MYSTLTASGRSSAMSSLTTTRSAIGAAGWHSSVPMIPRITRTLKHCIVACRKLVGDELDKKKRRTRIFSTPKLKESRTASGAGSLYPYHVEEVRIAGAEPVRMNCLSDAAKQFVQPY